MALVLLWGAVFAIIILGTVMESAARRRRKARAAEAEAKAEELARSAPGGRPQEPIVVSSPAVIDARAASLPCAVCTGPVQVVEHAAATVEGARLRVVQVACTRCGVGRAVYFRLRTPSHVN